MRVTIDFSVTERDFYWYSDRLGGVELRGERDVMARCPAHDDGRPSLHVWEDDQGLGVHCFAGCSRSEVDDALEDAAPTLRKPVAVRRWRPPEGEVVARYVYTDEAGEPLFRKLRFEPKDFKLQRASRPAWLNGGVWWSDGLKNDTGELLVQLVPYRLPELLEAVKRGAPVWIVDGEKDADRLATDGIAATCSPYGMARWRPAFSWYLLGAAVVVVADRDESGQRAASRVVASLNEVAVSVQVVEAAHGKDAFDHLEAGRSLDEFAEVVGV